MRYGMGAVDWPLIFGGLADEEVTTAEVLSEAGYATAFYAKWHLGDIPESYCHNQGFDEAFWALYNQVTSLQNATGEGANAVMGLMEEMLPPDPYKLDDTVDAIAQSTKRADGKIMVLPN